MIFGLNKSLVSRKLYLQQSKYFLNQITGRNYVSTQQLCTCIDFTYSIPSHISYGLQQHQLQFFQLQKQRSNLGNWSTSSNVLIYVKIHTILNLTSILKGNISRINIFPLTLNLHNFIKGTNCNRKIQFSMRISCFKRLVLMLPLIIHIHMWCVVANQ